MPDESRYEAALAAALVILHTLASRPAMARHERLATVTFYILDAIGQVEGLRPAATGAGGPFCPHCLAPSGESRRHGRKFRCRSCGRVTGTPEDAGRN